jgi:hypothetical protein
MAAAGRASLHQGIVNGVAMPLDGRAASPGAAARSGGSHKHQWSTSLAHRLDTPLHRPSRRFHPRDIRLYRPSHAAFPCCVVVSRRQGFLRHGQECLGTQVEIIGPTWARDPAVRFRIIKSEAWPMQDCPAPAAVRRVCGREQTLPLPGEHTEEIFTGLLGYDKVTVGQLRAEDVI